MYLGIEELHGRVREHGLVRGLSSRELEHPEGAGFDLRIGELYAVEGQGFLGVDTRETPKMTLLSSYSADGGAEIALQPNVYYVIKTIESVSMPDDLLALMTPRSTLFRSGVYIFGGQVAPGYEGELSMGMVNFRQDPFRLEMGARVVHIMFSLVQGGGSRYRGQWKGGRVTTEQREQQV